MLDHEIKKLYYFLDCRILNYDKIPRELYYLLDWFFGECEININYSISFSETLSMADFLQILKSSGFDLIYPEMFYVFERYEKFFFIFIPPTLKFKNKGYNWIVVLHEASHAIIDKENLVNDHYPPDVSNWIHILYELARLNNQIAKEKLQVIEYTADYITTFITGPGYVWRILEDFFELSMVLDEPVTHPYFDKRIENLINLLRDKLEFNNIASSSQDLLNQLIESESTSSTSTSSTSINNNYPDRLNEIIQDLDDRFPKFSFNKYTRKLNEKYNSISESKLKIDFKELKTIIIDPASLLTLICYLDGINEDKYQELFVNCLKLYIVSENFNQIFSS